MWEHNFKWLFVKTHSIYILRGQSVNWIDWNLIKQEWGDFGGSEQKWTDILYRKLCGLVKDLQRSVFMHLSEVWSHCGGDGWLIEEGPRHRTTVHWVKYDEKLAMSCKGIGRTWCEKDSSIKAKPQLLAAARQKTKSAVQHFGHRGQCCAPVKHSGQWT